MRRRLAALAAGALMLALLVPAASVSAASAIYVHPGESIQAAINRAPSGGLISVERGTYRGNLDVKRSVRLVGHDAVIVPAAKPTKNFCSDLAGLAGICVHGTLKVETGADPSQSPIITVSDWLSNVSIEGFTVRGFGGYGIIALGTRGFRAVRDVAVGNTSGGIATAFSADVSLLYNTARDNGLLGLAVENTPSVHGSNVIVGNVAYGNAGFGIGFADALGGRIALNAVYGNCAGIYVGASADKNSFGGGDLSISLNQVTANNRLCQPTPGGFQLPYGGIGLILFGARNTTISLNDVRDNVSQATSAITDGGGILLLDGKMFGSAPPTGNSIRLNWLSGNGPNDIFGDGTGTGNAASGNSCTTTNLAGAC